MRKEAARGYLREKTRHTQKMKKIENERNNYSGYAFLGENAQIYARFAAALFVQKFHCLIYDASQCKRLFIDQIGDIPEPLVRYHKATWTTDIDYVVNHANDYEMLIIYDDFLTKDNFMKYRTYANHAFISCTDGAYSKLQTEKIFHLLTDVKCSDCTYIYVGTEQSAKKNGILRSIGSMERSYGTFAKKYYVPFHTSDMEQFHCLAYGSFNYDYLSEDFKSLLVDMYRFIMDDHHANLAISTGRVYGV